MGWPVLDDYAKAKGVRVGAPSPGQTVGGTHAAGSLHYAGLARDYGRESDAAGVERLLAPLARGKNPPIIELYGIGGTSLKDGKAVSPEPAGHAGDHTHAAVRAGVSLADLMGANDDGLSLADQVAGFDSGSVTDKIAGAVPGLDAIGSIAHVFVTVAEFITNRGKFLLLVGAGLLLVTGGFALLAKDLAISSLVPIPKGK